MPPSLALPTTTVWAHGCRISSQEPVSKRPGRSGVPVIMSLGSYGPEGGGLQATGRSGESLGPGTRVGRTPPLVAGM